MKNAQNLQKMTIMATEAIYNAREAKVKDFCDRKINTQLVAAARKGKTHAQIRAPRHMFAFEIAHYMRCLGFNAEVIKEKPHTCDISWKR